MLRIAVCDDNLEMLSFISSKIEEEIGKNEIECQISSFSDGNELILKHKENPFDVAFLDICMPETNGFIISKQMTELSENLFVIFVTSKDELVYDCFDYRPFNFIRKGSPDMMSRSISEVIRKLLQHIRQSEMLILDEGYGEQRRILIRDIIYIKSDGHYLEYFLSGGNSIRIRENISGGVKKMEAYDFLQIHRRYLVNMKYIRNIDVRNDEVILINGERLDTGRSYKENAAEIYKKYMRTVI